MAIKWLVLVMGLFGCAIFCGQPKQMLVRNSALILAGGVEKALRSAAHLTGRFARGGFSFTMRYPVLTCFASIAVPMAFPRSRGFICRKTSQITHFFTKRIGSWLQQSLRGWLLGTFNDKLDTTQQGLDEQQKILGQHSCQLTDMQDTMGKIHEDTQSLIEGDVALRENIARIQEMLSGHTQKLDSICQQGSMTHDELAKFDRLIAELSSEQKRLFESYGGQFSDRFDQLSENLRSIVELMAPRQIMVCSRQSAIKVK